MIKASNHAHAADAYAFVYRLLRKRLADTRRPLLWGPYEVLDWLDTRAAEHERLATRAAPREVP